MIRLPETHYKSVRPLIKSNNEISAFSVIDGIIPGEIYADSLEEPKSALIKTPECNLIAGETDGSFLSEISSELDFWDCVTPDSTDWCDKIPVLHKNKFIRPFKRRRYVLTKETFAEREKPLPHGFVLEKVNLDALRNSPYKNAGKILDWAGEWRSDADFYQYGAGCYIRNDETIVSWSLSDCSYENQISIGIHTDLRFRMNGFGMKAASETVKECFRKGYETINWLCVDTNRGSISVAEKTGFKYVNDYYFYCSFLPTENLLDISEDEWADWARYLEESSLPEPRLINECLYSYIKANNVLKVIEIIERLPQSGETPDMEEYKSAIRHFQSIGMCSNFNGSDWLEFAGS